MVPGWRYCGCDVSQRAPLRIFPARPDRGERCGLFSGMRPSLSVERTPRNVLWPVLFTDVGEWFGARRATVGNALLEVERVTGLEEVEAASVGQQSTVVVDGNVTFPDHPEAVAPYQDAGVLVETDAEQLGSSFDDVRSKWRFRRNRCWSIAVLRRKPKPRS